jgi:hypothetical protein
MFSKLFDRVFSLVGFLMIYARLCTALVSSMFALQAYLPDYVISILRRKGCSQYLGSMAGSVKRYVCSRWEKYTPYPGVNTKGMNGPDGTNNDGIKS